MISAVTVHGLTGKGVLRTGAFSICGPVVLKRLLSISLKWMKYPAIRELDSPP
jgi:hypothetical protein